MIPRIQIAGIKNVAEADMVIRNGADGIGLLQMLEYERGDAISKDRAAEIVKHVKATQGSKVATVMITHSTDVDAIVQWAKDIGVSTLQIHNDSDDEMPLADLQRVRQALPGIGIIKSFHVPKTEVDAGKMQKIISHARALAPYVDALILDTKAIERIGGVDTKTLGGTGIAHNWDISEAIIAAVHDETQGKTKVIMAGGLNPQNVAESISKVKPDAVDVNSGVQVDGPSVDKDPAKVRMFCSEARRALGLPRQDISVTD